MSTPDQFKAVMAKFGSDTKAFLDSVLRHSVIIVTDEIVDLTPYKSGALRSSYVWDSAPATNTLSSSPDVHGTPSRDNARAFAADLEAGDVIYISNSVPYVGDVEFGTQTRNPSAMFRTVEARWVGIGKEAVKRALR